MKKNKKEKTAIAIIRVLIVVLFIVGCFFYPKVNAEAKVKKNADDVKALKEIIKSQYKKGGKVSKNLNDKEEYGWSKKTGKLIKINWSETVRLKGSLNLSKLTNLKYLKCSDVNLKSLNISNLARLEIVDCSVTGIEG